MLSFFAAVSAPLRIRSQKVSPGGPWVTIATVNRGVSAWPAPIPVAGGPRLAAGARTCSQRDEDGRRTRR